MNKIKITLFILFLSLVSTGVLNAKFLDRLNKRVQRSAENAAIYNAEQIATDKAGEAVEKGITKSVILKKNSHTLNKSDYQFMNMNLSN